jgi:hypothetical protein
MKPLELGLTKTHSYEYERGKLLKVSVRGAKTTLFRRHIKWAAEFYASKLMSRRMIESLDVVIKVTRIVDDSHDGVCTFEEHENGIRTFEIELDARNSERQMLINLAHEMVHVKQFSLGELKDGRPSTRTVWQGTTFDEDDIDYWDTPWEIEAHGREKGLFSRFKYQYKIMDLYKRPFCGDD